MKRYITLSLVSAAALAIFSGCGSSSSNSTNDELTGYFIDAPVANCEYETSSGKKGRTGSKGEFHYKKGDKVKFKLGELDLGEATPASDGLVTPASLTVDNESKVRLLRVLQALDSDNNPSNGITISDDVISALEKLAEQKSINDLRDDEDILNLNQKLKSALDEDGDGEIDVTHQEAQNHFETSLEKWKNRHSEEKGNGSENNSNGNHGGNGNGNSNSNGTDTDSQGNGEGHGDGDGFSVGELPKSDLNQAVIDSIAYMGNEERLAYDVYTTLYSIYGDDVKQFNNIAHNSEVKHVGWVKDLVNKYDIDITTVQDVQNPVANKNIAFEDMPTGKYDIKKIQELYDSLIEHGKASKQAALEVGCMVEVTDVDDLDRYIQQAQDAGANDVVTTFEKLRNGSYNHYWAFNRGLKNMGVSEGCGVLGEEYKKDYPQNEKDHGEE
jgi:hypothetical protein